MKKTFVRISVECKNCGKVFEILLDLNEKKFYFCCKECEKQFKELFNDENR